MDLKMRTDQRRVKQNNTTINRRNHLIITNAAMENATITVQRIVTIFFAQQMSRLHNLQ